MAVRDVAFLHTWESQPVQKEMGGFLRNPAVPGLMTTLMQPSAQIAWCQSIRTPGKRDGECFSKPVSFDRSVV